MCNMVINNELSPVYAYVDNELGVLLTAENLRAWFLEKILICSIFGKKGQKWPPKIFFFFFFFFFF